MPIKFYQLVNSLRILQVQQGFAVTVKESSKIAAVTVMGTILGGVLCAVTRAPLSLGTVAGGLAGAGLMNLWKKKKYKTLLDYLEEMTPEEKLKFEWHLKEAVKEFSPNDLVIFISLLNNPTKENGLEILAFLRQIFYELNLNSEINYQPKNNTSTSLLSE